MVALFDEIHAKVIPTQEKLEGGFLLITAALSPEEFIAKEEARNANAQDPTTYVNYKAEEMCKAAKGIDSPLGEALLAFQNAGASDRTNRWYSIAVQTRGEA
jgi:hypothetical protein